ncbi:hypothetical protein CGZ94_18030 [Enemella evansiae]|uniref:Uncharacterized protein n=1 Tax=Enemella evansiae TaxID=2016499 RepID=A0A255G256_9ACTN|nr:hypothetical protein [Enemella evansiae]OYO09562.1 hypothetical protein CGZ94_18030 [Enemella evansiae]
MTTTHPHLDEVVRTRRSRRLRILIGVCVMVLVLLIAWLVIAANAGRWGVPMFNFTNERGSQCRNDFFGHSCNPMTLEDISYRADVPLAADTKVLLGTWRQTHDFQLTARLVFPKESAKASYEALQQKFGECRQNQPSPLATVPDLTALCVMSNEFTRMEGGLPPDRLWQISSATQADGSTLVHMDIRSR